MDKKNIIVVTGMILLILLCISTVNAENQTDNTDIIKNTQTQDINNNIQDTTKTINKQNSTKNIKTATQTSIYVSPNGNDNKGTGTTNNPYKTIQKAINQAKNNNKIILKDGTYTLNNDARITINKNINITSNNKNNVIIQAKANKNDLFAISPQTTVTISNMQFKNINRGAIFSNSGKLTLYNVNFISNRINKQSPNRKAIINNLATVTINKCEFNKNMGYNGSAVYNVGNATITNTNIRNGNALFGGAIYSHYGRVTIKNCNITSNTVNGSKMDGWDVDDYVYTGGLGGAIFNRANMNIYNTLLQANKIPDGQYHRQQGGTILNYGTLVLNKSKILNSYIMGSGAAIYNTNSINIINSFIVNNEAEGSAGAILSTKKAVVTNTTINKNKGFYVGAILNSGKFQLYNSIINSNTASHSIILNNNEMLIKNMTAMSNMGTVYGLILNNEKITIHNSKILQNKGEYSGFLYNYGNVYINNSKINGNKAEESGGAIQSTGGTITIKATELNSNSAKINGGAIYSTNTILTISNCSIKGNSLSTKPESNNIYNGFDDLYSNQAYSYGGGIFVYGKTTKIINTNICYNTADCGGAIAIMNGTLLMNVSNVSGNNARYAGGAISVYYGENDLNPFINISKTNMNYNYAKEDGHAIYNGAGIYTGGRIYIYGSNINFNGKNQKASYENYVISNANLLKIYNTNLKRNNGTIIVNHWTCDINNCTLSENVNNNGYLIGCAVDLKITNTIIRDNAVKYALEAWEGQGPGKISVSKSVLYNKKATYEIYNSHYSKSLSNVKCDNNWWGTQSKPTNRVRDCKINSYYKGLK